MKKSEGNAKHEIGFTMAMRNYSFLNMDKMSENIDFKLYSSMWSLNTLHLQNKNEAVHEINESEVTSFIK